MVLDEKMIKRHLSSLSKKYPGKVISTGVLLTLVLFSVGLITMPLTAYFIFRSLSNGSVIIGAMAAVITVHIILAAFVYRGLREPAAEIEMKEE